jgi:hypothetical protein
LIARTMLATLAATAMAAALPAAALAGGPNDHGATATQSCLAVFAREPGSGPPPRLAEITVVGPDGTVRTDHFVPGPCTAPGFAKQAP